MEKGYFCKKEDGTEFVAAVWPGKALFPDMLNEEARQWFGNWYRFLLDQGIEGFWNDMNDLYNLAKNLKALRLQYGYTQKQVAEKLGIATQSYQAYEWGVNVPTLQNFIKLARLYDVSLDDLLE